MTTSGLHTSWGDRAGGLWRGRAAGAADVRVLVAERQRLVQAAQLRHLERRSDSAKRLGGSSDPAAARAIEQAVLHHLGAQVDAPLHPRPPTPLLQVISGSRRSISCSS